MSGAPIPAELQRFVLLAIPSVPYLEALLMLRADPARAWDAALVAKRLYLSEPSAGALLAELGQAQMVRGAPGQPGQFQYHVASPVVAELVEQLAILYPRNLIGISNLIHSKSSKKAQQFVDAFILRRDT